jgi:branched-chain amino acid transport system ATP-binding protein
MPAYDRVGLGIAMVPEGRRMFTNMTVLENLQMGSYSLKDKTGFAKDLE